jgi:hypothetical protein
LIDVPWNARKTETSNIVIAATPAANTPFAAIVYIITGKAENYLPVISLPMLKGPMTGR